jgi:hypothetical protein
VEIGKKKWKEKVERKSGKKKWKVGVGYNIRIKII